VCFLNGLFLTLESDYLPDWWSCLLAGGRDAVKLALVRANRGQAIYHFIPLSFISLPHRRDHAQLLQHAQGVKVDPRFCHLAVGDTVDRDS